MSVPSEQNRVLQNALSGQAKTWVVYARKALIIVVWLLIWELLTLVVGNSLLLAGPIETLEALAHLVLTSSFWVVTLSSFARIIAGFLVAFIVGILCAMFAARFEVAREFLNVGIGFMKSVPLACIVVLLLIWFGAKGVTVLAVFLVVMPALYFATLSGIDALDPRMIEMLHAYQVPQRRQLRAYVLPEVMSYITASCKLVIGMSWKAGVAAELIGIAAGTIGERIYQTKLLLMTADLFAWTAVVVVLAAVSEWAFLLLLRKSMDALRKGSVPKFVGVSEDAATCEGVAASACSLELNEAALSFDGQAVFCELSETIAPGERVALFAPSGSGKTSLMRLMMGLDMGCNAEVAGIAPVKCERYSVMFQEVRLIEEMSAVQNVALVCGQEVSESRIRELLASLLLVVEEEAMTDVLDRPVATLSGGQKRRVALVRALAFPSQAVFLDEPFASLDYDNKQTAIAFLNDNLAGRTLVFSTHDPADIAALRARTIEL